jgi:hypothetical protein
MMTMFVLICMFLDSKRDDKQFELDGRKRSPNVTCF